MSAADPLSAAISAAVAQALEATLPDLLARHLGAQLATAPIPGLKLAYSVREAAALTSLSEKYLLELLRSGELRSTRGGKGAWIIAHADLVAYLSGAPSPAPAPLTLNAPVRGTGQRKASGQR